MLSRRRALAIAVSIAVVAVTFAFVLPRIANYGAVWRVLRTLSWPWLCGLVAATLFNIATFPLPWVVALPRLGYLHALRLTQASTALSMVIPGGATVGMAASFAMLRSWGIDASAVALAVAVTGIFNQLSTFVFPVVAVVLLAVEGTASRTLELIALVALALTVAIGTVLALGLARESFAHAAGNRAAQVVSWFARLLRKGPVAWGGEAFVRFRAQSLDLVRHRWLALTVTTLVNQLSGFLILDLALRAFGIGRAEVSLAASFAAWSIGRLITSLPLTPGGVGFVELGLTGSLIGFGGPNARVVAAVLVYRAFSVVPTVVAGLVAGATWKLQRPAPESA